MIDAENLTRKFGDLTAVDNVTFHINDGEVLGLPGPNGAGKTPTVRMLYCREKSRILIFIEVLDLLSKLLGL